MIFLKLILTNLRRHRIRSFISIAGIAFSVAAMLTVVTDSARRHRHVLEHPFERQRNHRLRAQCLRSLLQQRPRLCRQARFPAGRWWLMPTRCSSASSPAPTTPSSPASASRRTMRAYAKPHGLAGDRVDFAQATMTTWFSALAPRIFLAPRSAAMCPSATESFHVIGILKTANGFEDGGVFMPLARAQTFFHKEGSSVITIKLRNKDDAAAFKAQVKQKLSQPHRASKTLSSRAPTRSSRSSRPRPGQLADAVCCSADSASPTP